jgi:hypothetical protein
VLAELELISLGILDKECKPAHFASSSHLTYHASIILFLLYNIFFTSNVQNHIARSDWETGYVVAEIYLPQQTEQAYEFAISSKATITSIGFHNNELLKERRA